MEKYPLRILNIVLRSFAMDKYLKNRIMIIVIYIKKSTFNIEGKNENLLQF